MDNQEDQRPATPPATLSALMAGEAIKNPGRRRFTRTAGLGASGVIITLSCKPVLGATAFSPSGFVSGNMSNHGAGISQGRSPKYWQATSLWPIPKANKFSRCFSCDSQSALGRATLGEVVSSCSADTQELGMHLTAALLNARAGWTPFLTETQLQAMYMEWRTRGYFSPIATVQWTVTDIVKYLKSTQT